MCALGGACELISGYIKKCPYNGSCTIILVL